MRHLNILHTNKPQTLVASECANLNDCRLLSSNASRKSEGVVSIKDKSVPQLSTAQKATQLGSDAFYAVIVLAGIALTGYIAYILGRELFSTQTPNGLYKLAYKKAIQLDRVTMLLGTPIKAYGQMNRRGRRQHVRSSEYSQDSRSIMNIEFHLEGSIKKATVFVEAVKVAGGSYEMKYVVVRVDSYPNEVVIVVDERE